MRRRDFIPRPLLFLPLLSLACAPTSRLASPAPERQVTAITTESGTMEFERYLDRRGSRHRLPIDPAGVWPALVKSYEQLSRLFHCGDRGVGAPIADSYRLEVAVLSELQPEGAEESVLETRLNALAYSPGTSGTSLQCSSTGALEKRLLNTTMLNLARD